MEGVPFVGDGACAHNLLQKGRPLIMRLRQLSGQVFVSKEPSRIIRCLQHESACWDGLIRRLRSSLGGPTRFPFRGTSLAQDAYALAENARLLRPGHVAAPLRLLRHKLKYRCSRTEICLVSLLRNRQRVDDPASTATPVLHSSWRQLGQDLGIRLSDPP